LKHLILFIDYFIKKTLPKVFFGFCFGFTLFMVLRCLVEAFYINIWLGIGMCLLSILIPTVFLIVLFWGEIVEWAKKK